MLAVILFLGLHCTAHILAIPLDFNVNSSDSFRNDSHLSFPNYTAIYAPSDVEIAADNYSGKFVRTQASIDYRAAVMEQIVCTKTLTCTARHRDEWQFKQLEAADLILSKLNTSDPGKFISHPLCRDTHSAAFLLEEGSENWPLACLWTGSDVNASCAPAPPSSDPIFYLTPQDWASKLEKFRYEIGCHNMDVLAAQRVDELYVCRKRCTESGVGYVPSIIMAASVLIVLAMILGDQ